MNRMLAAFLTEIESDDVARQKLAEALRAYLASPATAEPKTDLLSSADKAAQLGLHRDTLGKMARE